MRRKGDVSAFVRALSSGGRGRWQMAAYRRVPATLPVFGALLRPLPEKIHSILEMKAAAGLYRHQADALNLARQGDNVVLATSTASGKSLVYNLLFMERLWADPSSKALYLFPLKALARDQLRGLVSLTDAFFPEKPFASVYDGDTTAYRRRKIRQAPPPVVLTNPEMLHLSILPYHDRWEPMLSNLALVVIDEMHVYRGMWGSHMAQVLRRLDRICKRYGAAPTFVCCSATLGNPGILANQLAGVPMQVVEKSGAPTGEKHFLFVDPLGKSPAVAAVDLLRLGLNHRLRTIVYTRSRRMAEWIALKARGLDERTAHRISVYRAGFTADERREIESKLASGDLTAVVSTSALELGIDLGELDLCILVGYPGSIMATLQRSGRVGRRGDQAAVLMIAGEDALDRYILQHPDTVVKGNPEAALINPENEKVLQAHLPCAAAELPLSVSDPMLETRQRQNIARSLAASGELLVGHDGGSWYATRRYPHRRVSLRGVGERYRIILRQKETLLGEIDETRALKETHPGAIYLHRSDTYRVTRLDLFRKHVWVDPANPDHYTKVRTREETEIMDVQADKTLGACRVCRGRLRVTEQVTGYEIWQLRPHRKRSIHPLDLPAVTFETEGCWLVMPRHWLAGVVEPRGDLMGGLHAFEHAAIGMAPLLVLCDRNDIGGLSITDHPQLQDAGVFIYDGMAGGAGISYGLFGQMAALLAATRKNVSECRCEAGCPACVHSPKCGSGNRPMDKQAALRILVALLNGLSVSARKTGEDGRRLAAPLGRSKHVTAGSLDTEPVDADQVPLAGDGPPRSGAGGGHYVVFDLETRRSAAEVGGWQHADRMGVSCGVVFDSRTGRYTAYTGKEVPDLIRHLQEAGCVVGFNSRRFDYRVLSGYADADFHQMPTIDLLEHVHRALGFRLSLNHLAIATLGMEKSGDGLQALRWWQQGRMKELIAYCRKDVAITRDLFLYGRENGYLLFRDKAENTLRVPVDW